MGEGPKDEIKRLRAENERLRAELSKLSENVKRANLSQPMKTVRELDQARTQRDKALVERDKALAKLGKLSDDVVMFTDDLEAAGMAFCVAGTPDFDEGHKRCLRAYKMAVLAVVDFLQQHVVEHGASPLLLSLMAALEDAEHGIRNPTMAPVKSKRSGKGRPMRRDEVGRWASASWAVTGLIDLGETKTAAFDIVAEKAGLPREKLMKFRQGLTAQKRRGPKGAQIIYDSYVDRVANAAPSSRESAVKDVLWFLSGIPR